MARRKKKGRFLTFKVMLSLVVLFFILFLVNDYLKGKDGFFFYRDLKQQETGLEREIRQIEEANERLRAEISELEQPYYIEKIAREELDMVKEGEVIYYILEDGEGEEAQ